MFFDKSVDQLKKITPAYLQGITTSWDIIMMVALGSVLLMIPLYFIFPSIRYSDSHIFNYSISTIFFWDYLRSRKKHPKETKGFKNISFQILSIIPFPVLTGFASISSIWGAVLLGARLFKVPFIVQRIFRQGQNKLIQKKVKITMVTTISALIVHWLSCGWILASAIEKSDPITVYNKALYWTITTLTTVGYGDMTPHNNLSRLYTMLVMILGVGFYGIVISQFSRMMLEANKRKENTREKLENLTSFLNYYDIPAHIQDDTFNIYNHILNQKMNDHEKEILAELPKALGTELQIYMNMRPLKDVELFAHVSHECLREVASSMTQAFYPPDEAIIKNGDIGEEMYVISHGQVKVHLANQSLAHLKQGNCFGEKALIEHTVRGADVTSESYCELFVLSKESFNQIVSRHKDLRHNVHRLISQYKQAS